MSWWTAGLLVVFAVAAVSEVAWARRLGRRQASEARVGEVAAAAEQFSAAVAEALGPVMVKLADAFNDFGRTYARAMTDLAEKLAAQHEQDRRDDLLDQR